jgi:endo-1,4-beta-D-glucanase Y
MTRLSTLVAVSLLALLGCEGPLGATQVMVRVRTTSDVEPSLSALRVRLATRKGASWSGRPSTEIPLDGLSWPIDLPVLRAGDQADDAEFEIVVEGLDAAGARIVETRAVTGFAPQREKLLELLLTACDGPEPDSACLAYEGCHGERCASCDELGRCGLASVAPASSLPDLVPAADPGAGILPPPGATDGEDLEHCIAANSLPSQPFSSHERVYAKGLVFPRTGMQQGWMDTEVTHQYAEWKGRYLRETGCGEGEVFVSEGDATGFVRSDAHAQAMLIAVWMAGYDPRARQLFDGLVRFYLAHPSSDDPRLMAGVVAHDCTSVASSGTNTEGDLDLALALLLANKQWGSGLIDYHGLATAAMEAILETDAGPRHLKAGSRARGSDPVPTSVFSPAHFHAFAVASKDEAWSRLEQSGYALLANVAAEHSSEARLWPNFVADADGAAPRPARADEVEGAHDGAFGARAARAALRIGLHRLHAEDAEADALLGGLRAAMMKATAVYPRSLHPAYALDGKPLGKPFALSMAAALGPGSLLAPDEALRGGDKEWRELLWNVVHRHIESQHDYESDSMQLIATLAMSGSLWLPEAVSCAPAEDTVEQPLLVLSPGADGKDAYVFLLDGRPTANQGDHPQLNAAAWTWEGRFGVQRSLLDFDLSALPESAIITGATLKLYAELTPALNKTGHSQFSGTNELLVQRITSPWDEHTVTWDTQPTTAEHDQIEREKSRHNSENYVLDVTEFVRARQLLPNLNHGFALRLKTEGTYRAVTFASSDHADATLRPRLEISYRVKAP